MSLVAKEMARKVNNVKITKNLFKRRKTHEIAYFFQSDRFLPVPYIMLSVYRKINLAASPIVVFSEIAIVVLFHSPENRNFGILSELPHIYMLCNAYM